MKPSYITIVGGTPKIVIVDPNITGFNLSLRTDATTVEVSVEDPMDSVAVNGYTPPSTTVTPVWVAAPAAGSNGVIVFKDPISAIRLSKATNGTATVLQQGIR